MDESSQRPEQPIFSITDAVNVPFGACSITYAVACLMKLMCIQAKT